MKEINKLHNQLSGHLGIIAIPINNIKSVQGSTIECYNPELNYQLNCSMESISYSRTTNYSKAGFSFENKISATISGWSTENDRLLQEMLRYQFVVLLQNSDGNYSIIGCKSKGLSFSFENASSEDPNGKTGSSISFMGSNIIS